MVFMYILYKQRWWTLFVLYIWERQTDRQTETEAEAEEEEQDEQETIIYYGFLRLVMVLWESVQKKTGIGVVLRNLLDGDTDSGGPRAWTAQTSLYCIHCLSVLYRVCVCSRIHEEP